MALSDGRVAGRVTALWTRSRGRIRAVSSGLHPLSVGFFMSQCSTTCVGAEGALDGLGSPAQRESMRANPTRRLAHQGSYHTPRQPSPLLRDFLATLS
jgi:hypothetical protein